MIAIAGSGLHSLALRADATVLAWGDNEAGLLGNGTTDSSLVPVFVCAPGQVAPCDAPGEVLDNVVAISAGIAHSLALLADGTVVAWGGQGIFGPVLGDGTTESSLVPVFVCAPGQVAPCDGPGEILDDVVAISAGGLHNLALRGDGTVVAWGSGFFEFAPLGDGTGMSSSVPVVVCALGAVAPCDGPGEILDGVIAVSAGADLSLALRGDGTVVAWGGNDFGALLGNGGTGVSFVPVLVCAPDAVAPCDSPPEILDGVVAIAVGLSSLALLDNGTVVAWGPNALGTLGDGTTTDRSIPVPVCAPGQVAPCDGPGELLDGVVAIDVYTHSLALRADGTVLAWGDNQKGQLGDGTTIDRLVPVFVCAPGQVGPCDSPDEILTGVGAIAVGKLDHSLALVARPSRVTIGKAVDAGGGANTEFAFAFTPEGGEALPFSLRDGETRPFPGLGVGDYIISELARADFDLIDITCSEGADVTEDLATGTVSINIGLAGGEDVACIFTNQQQNNPRDRITIGKVVNGGDDHEFTFGFTPESGDTLPFTLGDGDIRSFDGLEAGDYIVAEAPEAGFDLVEITCSEGGEVISNVGDGTVGISLRLPAVEHVTCIFVNEPEDDGYGSDDDIGSEFDSPFDSDLGNHFDNAGDPGASSAEDTNKTADPSTAPTSADTVGPSSSDDGSQVASFEFAELPRTGRLTMHAIRLAALFIAAGGVLLLRARRQAATVDR